MAKAAQSQPVSPRFTTNRVQVTIDQRPFPIVNMNGFDVLIAGAPDWIVQRQKLDFCFVVAVGGKEASLPTYGVVLKNDAAGLEVRYQPPNARWRELLMRVISEENSKS